MMPIARVPQPVGTDGGARGNTRLPPAADVIAILQRAAIAGGAAAQRHFRPGANTTARVTWKTGGSPVTEADFAADAAIAAILTAELPGLPLLSEESGSGAAGLPGTACLVIDPIDGTRAFMAGRSEWCVSIALLDRGRPAAGVIHAPARNEMFTAATGAGARLNGRPLPARGGGEGKQTAGPIPIAGPKNLLNRLMADEPGLSAAEPLRALAYRLAAVASGAIGAAVASEGAHDWDIAAADVILAESGCVLLTDTGARPVYNGAVPVHPALVAAPHALADRLLPALARAVT